MRRMYRNQEGVGGVLPPPGLQQQITSELSVSQWGVPTPTPVRFPPWGAAADHEFWLPRGSKSPPETTHETQNEARGSDLGFHVRPREPPKGGLRATKRNLEKLASQRPCPWDAFGGSRPPKRLPDESQRSRWGDICAKR